MGMRTGMTTLKASAPRFSGSMKNANGLCALVMPPEENGLILRSACFCAPGWWGVMFHSGNAVTNAAVRGRWAATTAAPTAATAAVSTPIICATKHARDAGATQGQRRDNAGPTQGQRRGNAGATQGPRSSAVVVEESTSRLRGLNPQAPSLEVAPVLCARSRLPGCFSPEGPGHEQLDGPRRRSIPTGCVAVSDPHVTSVEDARFGPRPRLANRAPRRRASIDLFMTWP